MQYQLPPINILFPEKSLIVEIAWNNLEFLKSEWIKLHTRSQMMVEKWFMYNM